MAVKTYHVPIVKGNDNDYIEALKKIATSDIGQEFSLKTFVLTPITDGTITKTFEELAQDEELESVFQAGGKTFRALRVTGSHHSSVAINRTDNFEQGKPTGLEDQLLISIEQQPPDELKQKFLRLVAESQEATTALSVDNLGPLLGEQLKEHFLARENALTRLETLHSTLLHDFEKQRQQTNKELLERETSLQQSFAEREAKLDEEHAERLKKLDEKEGELEKHKKELDDRSSTHARRDLREKMKEVLTNRQTSFALSTDTKKRRGWVLVAYVLLLLSTGVLAVSCTVSDIASKTFDPWVFGRQVIFSSGFVVSIGFFLRWLNQWSKQHADEEFKLKQLELDIDRASWVVEMALEWKAEKGEDIPEQLVERLSANLFGAKTGDDNDMSMTTADAVVRALLDTAASAEVSVPGGKVQLNRQSLKALAKDEK